MSRPGREIVTVRVGIGYDSHRFDPGVPLVLGGTEIPGLPGLAGHSDGDAVVHAIIDAILGAAALGSIGSRFPDSDPELAGVSSLELLADTVRLAAARGYQVVNIDVSVVAERPRIAPLAGEMATRIAEVAGVEAGVVSVKGKTNEGMGWTGRGEGVAVLAVVLLAARREDAGGGARKASG